jgi:hypothetical protein
VLVVFREPKTKPIARESGKDMEMSVENLLHRGCTIREKQVHALAPQSALPEGRANFLCDSEHPASDVGWQIR